MHASKGSHVLSCEYLLNVQVFVDGQLVSITDRDHTAKVKHQRCPASDGRDVDIRCTALQRWHRACSSARAPCRGLEGCGRSYRCWLQVSFVLPANSTGPSTLDVAVHALGRFNFGCVWDTKGLQNRGQLESSNVTLNGRAAMFACLYVRLSMLHAAHVSRFIHRFSSDHLMQSVLCPHRPTAAGLARVTAAA